MNLQDNSTNYFGCLINDELRYFGINTAAQGYTNIGFGILVIIYMGYYVYLLIKLLKIPKTSFTYKMIALTILIIIVLALFVYLYFDYSLFCISGILSDFSFPSYIIITMISIFLFDYIICSALKSFNFDMDSFQEDLNSRIRLTLRLKLPLLIIYIILLLPFSIFSILIANLEKIFYWASTFYSIFYLFAYCYFLMDSMNFYGRVLQSRQPNSHRQVNKQLLLIKIAIGSHFISSISWIISIQVYNIFTNKDSWFYNVTNYCFSKGCLWSMITVFIYEFLAYYLLFFSFGLFINQFANLELSLKSKDTEEKIITSSYYEENQIN